MTLIKPNIDSFDSIRISIANFYDIAIGRSFARVPATGIYHHGNEEVSLNALEPIAISTVAGG